MIVAVTGHRPNKLNNEYSMNGQLSTKIYRELEKLIKELKPTKMISGMALGVDIIFANLAINKKIPLIAAIPFIGQESKWPLQSQGIYNKILSLSTEKKIVSTGGYANYKMQVRNKYMVDRCDLLIAVWDGTEGGTYNCVNYAIDRGKPIRRINPLEL